MLQRRHLAFPVILGTPLSVFLPGLGQQQSASGVNRVQTYGLGQLCKWAQGFCLAEAGLGVEKQIGKLSPHHHTLARDAEESNPKLISH